MSAPASTRTACTGLSPEQRTVFRVGVFRQPAAGCDYADERPDDVERGTCVALSRRVAIAVLFHGFAHDRRL